MSEKKDRGTVLPMSVALVRRDSGDFAVIAEHPDDGRRIVFVVDDDVDVKAYALLLWNGIHPEGGKMVEWPKEKDNG